MPRLLDRILLGAILTMAAPVVAQPLDQTPRLAVISAFPPEWLALQEGLDAPVEHVVNGNRFLTGRLADQDVVLFLSGISMVNAAMTTQLALDRFEIEGIVFSGIAGGVDPDLAIGDVVVADNWGQYLETVFARETDGDFAIPPWMSSDFSNYGMIFTRSVGVVSEAAPDGEDKFWFASDAGYLEVARQIAQTVSLDNCNTDNACLGQEPKIVVGGNGVSGSSFVDNADFRDYVFETFEARVLDMESAAVAHVAHANALPFIAFRSLSDLAGGGDAENELPTFFSLAATNSAAVVTAFLEALPAPE
ncbi:5'-methylthioadenosine/S-adenosylhomocysteine nucleosidase [Actibacterium sp. 188UL27-1]|uniref:5'-methylthioadenosine/S-adenosylhomocysteine nucleosidase n=1 Tax=Actibacterium sp. 188UL27-1 TaxID=2786961 RepID=UPI00195A6CFC|nr:5'-methylthioadenosine/S-adenosylhomocysteine nucleosidase [Actibacterium sp. 188UL27-1]MBM7066771.1 5'-methylthioadenosine/S-adenosylhomocysteine nucleosidase [Actibacterium sp. 188UL27-1]